MQCCHEDTHSPMAPNSRATVTARAGALVGLGALALIVRRAADMADSIDDSTRGRVLARLDIGSVVVIVGLMAMMYRPWVRRHLTNRPSPAARSWWWSTARRVMPVWWLTVVIAGAATGIQGGPRQLAITLVGFRDPRSIGPLPGLGVGWILAVVAGAGLLIPLWSRVIRRTGLTPARQVIREFTGIGGLIGTGLTARLLCGLTGATEAFGPLSWLPAQLAPVGAGMALAVVVEARRVGVLRSRPDKRVVVGVGIVSIAAAAVATFASGLALHLPPTSTVDILVSHILALLVATGVGYILLNVPNRLVHPATAVLATAASGLLLFGEPITDLVARQYRERVSGPAGRLIVDGPAAPLAVWSTAICAALGTVLAVCYLIVRAPKFRVMTDKVAWRFAMAGVTAAAFLVRLAGLLAVAPERTDGGDPLFYHTTANMLAEGKGFLEPLSWIAHGKRIASALHGPMYPMMLSLTSRFGGITYFDHKMLSLIIGSATVLVVGAIARRLGGPWAGLIAGALAACYPNLWMIDGVLFPEGLFALLTTTSVWAVFEWRDRSRRALFALGAGGLVGLAALTRGEGLLLGPLMIAPWFLTDRAWPLRRRVAHLALAAAACVAVITPWAVRNSDRFNVAVPLSTNGNELIVYANCDETYSGKFLGFWLFDCQDQIRAEIGGDPPGDEAEKSNYWRARGLEYAKDHASQLPKVVAARVGRQWELFRPWQNTEFAAIEGRNVNWARIGLGYYYGLVAAGILGFLHLRRRRAKVWPLLAQIVSVTITAAYAYGTTRFRAPAEPVLCVFAGVGLTPLLGRAVARLREGSREVTDSRAFVLGGSGGLIRRGGWISLAVIGAVVAAPLRGLYRSSGSTMEEGFMLTFPERVLAGDVPNVDFLHLYGPGSLDLLAATYQIFGVRVGVERTFGLAQHLLIILGIYALTRAWGRLAAAGCATLSAILVLTPIGLSALAWNGGVGLGLWSIVLALRARRVDSRGWSVASAALAGLALTFRPDLAVALGVTHLFLWWRAGRTRQLIGAAFVGLLPMFVHLARAGIGPSIEGMFIDPVAHLRPGRELPRPPSWDYFQGALQVIADKFPPWWGVPHIAGPHQLFLWFFLLPVVALGVLVVAWWAHRRSDDLGRSRTLLAAAIFGVGLLPQAFQRPDSAHFAWVSCVCFALAPVAIVEILRVHRPTWPRVGRVSTGLLAVAATFLLIFPYFSYRPYLNNIRQTLGQVDVGLPVRRGERTFYLGDTRPTRAAQQVIDDLSARSKPGERLLVGPVDLRSTVYSDVFFYYLFPELPPATYYIEMDPGLANVAGSRLADDVASADWLILTRYWSGWIEPNTSTEFGDDRPNQVVEDQFCLVGSYENDLVRLYNRCAGGDGTGPYEGPYQPTYDYAVEVTVPVPPRPDGTSPFDPGPYLPLPVP